MAPPRFVATVPLPPFARAPTARPIGPQVAYTSTSGIPIPHDPGVLAHTASELIAAAPRSGARPIRIATLAEALAYTVGGHHPSAGGALSKGLPRATVGDLIAPLAGGKQGACLDALPRVHAALMRAGRLPEWGARVGPFLTSEWVYRGAVEALVGAAMSVARLRSSGRSRAVAQADDLGDMVVQSCMAVLSGSGQHGHALGMCPFRSSACG